MGSIPEQYHVIVAVGALMVLLIIVVSAAQKYQAYQVQKELVLRSMLRLVQDLQDTLDSLQGVSIPKKLSILLRKEVLARYVAMRQIHKNIKDIAEDISLAQRKLQSAESLAEPAWQPASDRAALNRYVSGLTRLIEFMQHNARITGMSEEDKQQFIDKLADVRADYLNDFHVRECKGLAKQEMWSESTGHIKELINYLSNHGPGTVHVTEVYKQANEYYKQVVMKQVPGEPVRVPQAMTDAEQANEAGQAELS